MIYAMGRPLKDFQTVIAILAGINWGNLMVKEFTVGKMGKSTMDNGKTDSNTATASGTVFKGTRISVNGLNRKPMDMEYTPGRPEIGMRANGIWH